jgi:hypothetical protein
MIVTVNVRACFYDELVHPPDELPPPPPSTHFPDLLAPPPPPPLPPPLPPPSAAMPRPLDDPDPSVSRDSCRYFLFGYGGTRLVLTAYTLHVACHVADARPRALRELLVVLLGSVYAATFFCAGDVWFDVSGSVTAHLLGFFSFAMLDTAAFTLDDFLPLPAVVADAATDDEADGAANAANAVNAARTADTPPRPGLSRSHSMRITFSVDRSSHSRCVTWWSRLRLRVPLDKAYLVGRHERMVLISVRAQGPDHRRHRPAASSASTHHPTPHLTLPPPHPTAYRPSPSPLWRRPRAGGHARS